MFKIRRESVLFICWLINVTINSLGDYRIVEWPHHSPNGAVIRVSYVMNMVVESRTLVLAAIGTGCPKVIFIVALL